MTEANFESSAMLKWHWKTDYSSMYLFFAVPKPLSKGMPWYRSPEVVKGNKT